MAQACAPSCMHAHTHVCVCTHIHTQLQMLQLVSLQPADFLQTVTATEALQNGFSKGLRLARGGERKGQIFPSPCTFSGPHSPPTLLPLPPHSKPVTCDSSLENVGF